MIKVQFLNSGDGELDVRVVETEDEIKAAVLEMVAGFDHLAEGDKIVVGWAEA